MKNNLPGLITVCFAILVLASCTKPVSELALYIPKDASFVFIIDPKSVMDKIASSGITIDSLANLFTTQRDEYVLQWNDIKNSGIDLNKAVYVFSKQVNSVQEGNIKSGAFIAAIEDSKKLEAFLKKEKVGGDVLSGGKYKYIALGNDYIAGWTDKILIISIVTGGNSAPGKYSTGEGTLSQQQLTSLFTQSESSSIASLGEFRDILAKPGDAHFYTNVSANLTSNAMLGMTKASTLLEGSYTEGVINFEKGKIVASLETHNNKTLSDILDKYPSKEINIALLKNYPDSLSGFGIISFNPKVLIDILRYLGFDSMADGFTSDLGFTTNDVVNALNGDIALMFSGASDKMNESINPEYKIATKTNGNYLVKLQIGDKTAFDKVLSGLLNKNILSKNGDFYQLGTAGGHGFVITVANNNLIIASGSELAQAYSMSEASSLPADIEKEINSKSMALYVDINSLLGNKPAHNSAGIRLNNRQYDFANTVQAANAAFKNFIATTDKSDGKTIKGNVEMNFVNTNENSLASLSKFLLFAHKESVENKKDSARYPPLSGSDSSAVKSGNNNQ